jgi:short subunit dehydrogenase-like uncharacterized protein
MEKRPRWMIYGSTGYTGRLITQEAVQRGLEPMLAGRRPAAVEAMAAQLHQPYRVFALDDPHLADHLQGVELVLNCAGPFSVTAVPLMEACIHAGVHYLDITGEIEVIEAAAARSSVAHAAGVMLVPAVGFDVVPSDCLAKSLADKLPGATHLALAFTDTGGVSPGTAKTVLEMMPRGGRVRLDGHLVHVPPAWKMREIPFRSGTRWAMTVPWGDVASAYYSTGIKNIETYMAAPPKQINRVRRWGWAASVLNVGFIRTLAVRHIDRHIHGPTASELENGRASFWAQVTDAGARRVTGTLETPSGYKLTKLAAIACVERVLGGQVLPGFATPSQAFGKELILSIPGAELTI